MSLVLEKSSNANAPKSESKRGSPRLETGKGGYGGYTALSYVNITVFNISLGVLLFLIALPVMIILAISVYLTMGTPILYRGIRLGRNRKPFYMYKFRTLPKDAEKTIGSSLLSSRHGMTTPFTRLLRDTRLDELPQLWNIIAGDMDFVGPRPLRPEIYESCCKLIPGYDARFQVRPGLIGYAQLFTPHSTPKRIRSLIDSRSLRRQRKLKYDILLLAYTVLFFGYAVIVNCGKFLWKKLYLCVTFKRQEMRAMERVDHGNRKTYFFYGNSGSGPKSPVLDMSDGYLRVHSNQKFAQDFEFHLECDFTTFGRHKHKIAKCKGVIFKEIAIPGEYSYAYIIQYEPLTPLNAYIVEQYFLHKSFALP